MLRRCMKARTALPSVGSLLFTMQTLALPGIFFLSAVGVVTLCRAVFGVTILDQFKRVLNSIQVRSYL